MIDARKILLRNNFIEKRGYWDPFWEGLLDLNPDFFESYLNYSAIPWQNGRLEPKTKELIYIAIDAATTHLYTPGLAVHLKNSLRYGATALDIMETYKLTSSIGMQTMLRGCHILASEIGLHELAPLPEANSDIRSQCTNAFGYWDEEFEAWLRLNPESLTAAMHAWGERGECTLNDKSRAFILLAINAAVTHLNERAMRIYIRLALKNGATQEEIIEVLQLASVLGMHTCTAGIPLLQTALAKHTGSK
ncbi:carboxymuconolactone decarboxylase family protein [Pseudomonas tolaasii]